MAQRPLTFASFNNVRSASNPRQAALQGLEKMRALAAALDPVDLGGEYPWLRIRKSDEEIAWMRIGAAFSDLGIEALATQSRPGMTERELGNIVERAYHDALYSGEAAALPLLLSVALQVAILLVAAIVNLLVQVDKHGGAVQEPLRQFGGRLQENRRARLKEQVGKLTVKMTMIMVITLLPALLIITAGPGFMSVMRSLQQTGGH